MPESSSSAFSVEPREALVSFGAATTPTGSSDDYELELVSVTGKAVASHKVWSPRKAIVEQEGIVENAEGILVARFAFRADAATVRIRDQAGTVVAETDVRSVIREFCRRLKNDPDCAKVRALEN